MIEDPRWGDSLVDDDGEETVECRGELEESEEATRDRSRLW